MQQIVLNQFEKIGSTDQNNIQFAIAQMIQEQFLYNFLGQPSGGCIQNSFLATFTSTFVASLAAGIGFFYDGTQTGFNPKFRQIFSNAAIPVTILANTNANNRVDLICLAPNFAVTANASRYVKTGGVGPVVLTSVPKLAQDGYTLQVVAGTPGVSPVAPSTPSGFIAIAQVLNRGSSAGMSGSGAITDVRTGLFAPVNVQLVNIVTLDPGTTPTYTLTTADNGKTFLVLSGNGAVTFNMPTPVLNFNITVKDAGFNFGTNACTFHRHGSENFEGLAADYIASADGGEWHIGTDGTSWFFTAK